MIEFDYLHPSIGPVVDGLEQHETIVALERAEYIPLRVLRGLGGISSIYRCEMTPEQRQMVAEGADVLVEILGLPMAPSRVMLLNQKYVLDKDMMAQWFCAQAKIRKK